MKAYAQDLREHVLRAVDDGYPRAEVVQMFGISLSTLKRPGERTRASSPPTIWCLLMSAAPTLRSRPCMHERAIWGTSQGKCSAQPGQEYDAHRRPLSGRHGSHADPRIGSANTTAFELYIEQVLAPNLHAEQIVVMDNLQAHKSARVKQAIEAKGCQLLFLPGYSPDLSPIEEAFSKLKTARLRAGARTREALQEAIGQALLTITAQDAQGWFQHCGYLIPQERKS
jgi:transposase